MSSLWASAHKACESCKPPGLAVVRVRLLLLVLLLVLKLLQLTATCARTGRRMTAHIMSTHVCSQSRLMCVFVRAETWIKDLTELYLSVCLQTCDCIFFIYVCVCAWVCALRDCASPIRTDIQLIYVCVRSTYNHFHHLREHYICVFTFNLMFCNLPLQIVSIQELFKFCFNVVASWNHLL